FLLEDADSGHFFPALHHKSSIRDETNALPRHDQRTGLPGEPGQVIPARRAAYQQRVDFRVSETQAKVVASPMQRCLHKMERGDHSLLVSSLCCKSVPELPRNNARRKEEQQFLG